VFGIQNGLVTSIPNLTQADKLLEHSSRLEMGGRPVIVIEWNQRPKKSLQEYQIELEFSKAVYPSTVLKKIES
jgi:tRNA A37 threonylcarbamoyladenosine biosynthesis protein TsaE